MIYRLINTKPAKNDIIEIGTYIANELHSTQAALDLLDEIDKKILSLNQMPKRYALVSDKRLAKLGIRKMPVDNYLVFYRVDEHKKTVTIVRVLYGSRDWVNLL
jgi:toxin ParE1/3/4